MIIHALEVKFEGVSSNISEKLLERYTEESIKSLDIQQLSDEIFKVICVSIADVLVHFIEDNSNYFDRYVDLYKNENIEDYIDSVILNDGLLEPFINKEPKEFFKTLEDLAKKIQAQF